MDKDEPGTFLEVQLRRQALLFRALHAIEHTVLVGGDELDAATRALETLPQFVTSYWASGVFLHDENSGKIQALTWHFYDPNAGQDKPAWPIRTRSMDDGDPDSNIAALSAVLEYCSVFWEKIIVSQSLVVSACDNPPGVLYPLWGSGAEGIVILPQHADADRQATGGLFLVYGKSEAISAVTLAGLQQITASLALAIQQIRRRRIEVDRLQEAEAMRDVVSALAGAADLKQTLEVALVNLHTVIEYDRAGLFLGDEARRSGLLDDGSPGQEGALRAYSEDDPLVITFQNTHRPILVEDVHQDARFQTWPDLEEVHAWVGAPLFLGGRMIGFLGLGSMAQGAYSQADAERLQVFAYQVSEMLEKAWLFEQSRRRTAELEVLSNLTSALGQAETSGSQRALAAIAQTAVQQVSQFFETLRSVFLFPELLNRPSKIQRARPEDVSLVVKFSMDGSLVGWVHPYAPDLLWRAFLEGETQVLTGVREFLQQPHLADIYPVLLEGAETAAFVPLKSGDTIEGVVCLIFDRRRRLNNADIQLFNTFAEIAGSSLRRAATLEMLEKQVNVQAQHLATLYAINAVSSEVIDFNQSLQQVLDLMLSAMQSQVGAIHLIEELTDSGGPQGALRLVAQQNLDPRWLPGIELLSLKDEFWRSLLDSTSPVVMTDIRAEARFPLQPVHAPLEDLSQPPGAPRAFIGAPIRSKGRVFGLLSLFGETILEYTIEDITLFMTIADQVGGLVERARLMRLASQAAVVEERQRLARELHDSITQLLYGQVLFAGAGLKVMRQNNFPLAEQHVERLNQAALQALKEMRLLVFQLRPSDMLGEGLVRALERRLEAVEKRSGMTVSLDVHIADGKELNLSETAELTLYRIAEEALNNMLKHAEASQVQILVHLEEDWIKMEISDNGRGFDVLGQAGSGGMGIINMRERAAALGGTCEWFTTPGKGTRVVVKIMETA